MPRLKNLYPDLYVNSTYGIRFDRLYEDGYRGLVFDIDNTLVPHGAPADDRAKGLFKDLKELGFSCCLISNNQEERVQTFNRDLQVSYIYKAHKPSPTNYIRAMEILGTDRSNTLFIGDQILTDIWGANRAGIFNIMVKKIYWKEEIQIVLKRALEFFVLIGYRFSARRRVNAGKWNRYFGEDRKSL